MLSKSKSTIDLMEGLNVAEVADIGLEGQYAQTSDILNTQFSNGILGRHLVYKQIDEHLCTALLHKKAFYSTHAKSVLYEESHPEAEYEKKLKSLLDFLKQSGPTMPAQTFYAVIERVVDEFRPALLLELFHNDLRLVIREFSKYLSSDFCHMRLIGCVQQISALIESRGDQEMIAIKLRKFFIPVLSLLSGFEETELEVMKSIKRLLANQKVSRILTEVKCEKDEIPIGIDESQIPSLMDFGEESPFLQVDPLGKIEDDAILSIEAPGTEKTGKQLTMRRCCSTEDFHSLYKPELEAQEVALNYLTINTSVIANEVLKKNVQDRIETLFGEVEAEAESEDLRIESPGLSPLSPSRSPQKSPYLPSMISGLLQSKSFQNESEDFDQFPKLTDSVIKKREGDVKADADFYDLVNMETAVPVKKEWKFLLKSNALTIIAKPLQSRTLYIVKCYGTVHYSPIKVYRAVAKKNYRVSWDNVLNPTWVSVKDKKAPTLRLCVHSNMGIFPRDFVIRQSYLKDFPSDGCYVVHFKSVENKECPVDYEYVRSKMQSGGVVIRPISEGQSLVNIIIKADLSTLLPQRLLFRFYRDFLTQWFERLERGCELE